MVAERLLWSPESPTLPLPNIPRAMAREPSEREHAWGEALGRLRAVRQQEEEAGMAEGPTSDGGQDAQDPAGDTPSAKTVSSASDDGPTPTRRDMNRIKSRLVRMAEHLRTTVSDNKVESNQALEQEVQTRRDERVADLEPQALLAPALMRLLDERIGALGTGVRALVDKLRIDTADSMQEVREAQALLQDQMREMEASLLTINESAQVAMDTAMTRESGPRSDWSD